jgi:predicted SAM-dependent methyltransferase
MRIVKSKIEKMLANINPAKQKGIEIGALYRPTVKKETGPIFYADFDTTETLRSKYAEFGLAPSEVDKIVDVDYVLGGKNLSEAASDEAPFDYVLASHVIEHVPDFVGWLQDIRKILKPGGILSLAIPDKRFTFDYQRRLTASADVVDAYLSKTKIPTPRQAFDQYAEFDFGWVNEGNESDLIRRTRLLRAWNSAKEAAENKYDSYVHCWVFTDSSFLDLASDLVHLDLFDYKIISYFGSSGIEFVVNLEAIDYVISIEEKRRIQLESISKFRKQLLKGELFRRLLNYKYWPVMRRVRIMRKRNRK